MKILEIREITAPLRSSLRNTRIDFGQMTTSVVAAVAVGAIDMAHLFAVHIALGLGTGGNESYPGVFEPYPVIRSVAE